jgi:hypothetical protein
MFSGQLMRQGQRRSAKRVPKGITASCGGNRGASRQKKITIIGFSSLSGQASIKFVL